ncbi:MAG: hypothetical protein HY554_04270 [Elusimicrobia bacterium]|nr:hypothetical protein [Elusimicrobiota bacterium]
MRIHLYEFRASNRMLKCSCGWERELKSAQPNLVSKTFTGHCRSAAQKS